MHAEQFLQDLAVVLIVAGVVTVIFHQLKQPVVLGYIVAGVLVGHHTPGIPLMVKDEHTVKLMSELGMILLMFSLGLHFSLKKLAKVGATAFIAASLEILLMLAVGYGVGRSFGWSSLDSLFLGAILSISSTTIIIKALNELGMAKQKFAELIFGILIVEDILAIAMIALLSGVVTTGSLAIGAVGLTLAKLSIFLATVMVVGLLLVPILLRYVNRFRSNEMLLVASLGLCFGVSLLAHEMGYSVALGAFLIGAIVAEAREHGRVEALIEPVRDMFSAIFFVAIGMLIEPKMLITYAVPIAVITAVVIVGKVMTCAVGTFLAGNNARTSMRVGMGLAQIGEFSFIIAQLGLSLEVMRDGVKQPATSAFLYPIAVTVSALTTLFTPYLIRSSDRVVTLTAELAPRRVVTFVELYTAWVDRITHGQKNNARRLIRRWSLQILLNLTLMTAIFIAAAAMGRKLHDGLDLPRWTGGSNGLMWLAAMVLSLPLLIVSIRKLRAISLVGAEATIRASTPEQTLAARGLVSATIRVGGSIVILLYLLLLSTAVMPPWPVLIVLVVTVIALATWRWRTFERVYAAAQCSLTETLTRPPEPAPMALPQSLVPVLRDAQLETIEIADGAFARGKLIRELQLRTRSGASVVGIERAGTSVVNPGPDEELQTGDRVLLLGKGPQLEAARTLLLGIPAPQTTLGIN